MGKCVIVLNTPNQNNAKRNVGLRVFITTYLKSLCQYIIVMCYFICKLLFRYKLNICFQSVAALGGRHGFYTHQIPEIV